MHPHDFMALVPVVEGAGGLITDWSGNPLTMESDGRILAAADRTAHGAALAILGGRSARFPVLRAGSRTFHTTMWTNPSLLPGYPDHMPNISSGLIGVAAFTPYSRLIIMR